MSKHPLQLSFRELWGITEERERELLALFRENLERTTDIKGNATFDDYYLRRFLRARSHDLNKAQTMFVSHLEWRKEFGTDTILEDFVYDEREAFLALYPQGYHKVDKLGRPIYIQHLGQINMKAMKNVTTEERMIRFHVQEYERALKYIFPACSEVAGEHVSQTLAIMDLKGLGLRHLSGDVKRILSVLTRIDQDNYPETLGKTLIINAPKVFRAIWSMVKPMLDPRTQAKIEVCPSDFLPVLKEWVEVENIPSYLGGTSRGSLIDDVGPWREDTSASHPSALRIEVESSAAGDAGVAPRVDTGARRMVESGESDESDDDFVSVVSVDEIDNVGTGRYHGINGMNGINGYCGTKEDDTDDDEDRVAVVDKKIRKLRKLLGIRDDRANKEKKGQGNTSIYTVIDDLSKQLDSIMDRVSEILADEAGDDETATRGSSAGASAKGKGKAQCGCC